MTMAREFRMLPIMPAMLLALGLLVTSLAPSHAIDAYVVTRDERELFGAIDARTNDRELWLAISGDTYTIRRAIRWEEIDATWLDKVELPIADFRLAALTAADLARQDEAERGSSQREVDEAGNVRLTIRGPAPAISPPVEPPPRIASLQLDAFLANWDADVEPDGLIARIQLLDRHGQRVAADATLDLDFWATRQYAFSEKPQTAGQSVEPISRWSKFVRAANFDASGTAEVRLPFQALDPEVTTAIGRYGLVHARAAVAGHGVFDASVDGVRLRTFAPNRDQLQRFGQDRFLPTEQRGLYRP